MRCLSSRRIDTEIVLRAAAITAVCFNHAHPERPFDYAGGMTVLLMLSGLSFARFALEGGTPQSVRTSIARLALQIWLPCTAIVILSFIARQDFEWKELLFVSNWFTPGHISFLFVWYPQVLLQILAALFLVFSFPFIPQEFLRRPLAGSLWFLGLAIVAREIDPLLRSGSGSALPHMVAWNFLLGWALFFAMRQLKVRDDRSMRALVASGVVACAFWAYGPFALNVWTLSLAGIALVYVPSVSVPSFLARLVLILSQAAYAIYLLHVIFLRIYTVVLGFHDPNGAWLFAMLGSTLSWIAGTAFLRAYRKIERERPGRIRAGSAGRFWAGGRAVPEGAPR